MFWENKKEETKMQLTHDEAIARIKELEESRESIYHDLCRTAKELDKYKNEAVITKEEKVELNVYRKIFARLNLTITKEDLC